MFTKIDYELNSFKPDHENIEENLMKITEENLAEAFSCDVWNLKERS
jgi:hypothetical protein